MSRYDARRMKKLFILILLIAVSAFADDVIRRGVAIPADATKADLADVLARPANYTTLPVVTEGVIDKVCQQMGCWMEIAPKSGDAGMHVTFKDEAFVVPKDCSGRTARLFGRVSVEDGKSSFVASGVELRKAPRN